MEVVQHLPGALHSVWFLYTHKGSGLNHIGEQSISWWQARCQIKKKPSNKSEKLSQFSHGKDPMYVCAHTKNQKCIHFACVHTKEWPTKVEVVAVGDELWQIEKLWDKFLDVGHVGRAG